MMLKPTKYTRLCQLTSFQSQRKQNEGRNEPQTRRPLSCEVEFTEDGVRADPSLQHDRQDTPNHNRVGAHNRQRRDRIVDIHQESDLHESATWLVVETNSGPGLLFRRLYYFYHSSNPKHPMCNKRRCLASMT